MGGVNSLEEGNPSFSNSLGQLPEVSRWRDLFPLPTVDWECPGTGHLSASARRRRCRVGQLVRETNDIVEVLNEIYAPSSEVVMPKVCTKAHKECHHAIYKQLSRMERVKHSCTEREAILKELLQSSPAYGGQESTTVRVYDRALVSIPSTESDPIPIAGLLDNVGRETIEDFSRCMMLSEEEWGRVVEKGDFFRPYMDAKLQESDQEYQSFVKDLFDAGMIAFTSEPLDIVTPFL